MGAAILRSRELLAFVIEIKCTIYILLNEITATAQKFIKMMLFILHLI